MDDFLWRALLGGLGIALVTGPLGCFIVWRRMAYFGDTLAHSALLGIAIGFLFQLTFDVNLPLNALLLLSTLFVCIAIALLLVILQSQKQFATDTLLGILAHSTLSLGLVAVAFLQSQGLRIDLFSYLFGDLLTITYLDLYWIYAGSCLTLLGIISIWQSLLSVTIHEELAQVEGIAVVKIRLFFMLLVALVVAIAMKIIGILLVTSMLIIPPATARRFSKTPEQMAILSSLIGCIAVGLGLFMSWHLDIPTGPSVVVAASLLFTLTFFLKRN
ncbi:iron chelate uptake ABC transporter family permease subunit [Candidatus Halobeggiatoa sp. HSG11]|nr:iron chelate uptake ABC transporter family permease subunit [Candidatus Halobeggiatoa sp. HSG11]